MNAPLILVLLLLACLACGPHATAQGPYVKKWDRTLGGTTSEFTCTGRGQFDKARNSTLQFVLSYKLKLQNGEIPSFPNDKCGSFIDSWMLEIDSQGNIINSKLYCSSIEIGLVGSLDYRQYKLIIGMTNARRANDGSVVARNIGSSHDIWIVQVDSNFNEVDSWRMGGAMDDYLLYPTFLINGDTLYVAASVTSNWKNMPLQINGQITDMNYAAYLNYDDLAAKYYFTLDSEDTVYHAHSNGRLVLCLFTEQ